MEAPPPSHRTGSPKAGNPAGVDGPAPLVINGRFLTQPLTGVQRFALEITRELIGLMPDAMVAVPRGTTCSDPAIAARLLPIGRTGGTWWEQTELMLHLARRGGVLLNLCNTAPLLHGANVVTVHDLGVYEQPDWYDPGFVRWYRFLTPRIVRRAAAVLTVSESSRRALTDRFGIPAERVHVVYNGLSPGLRPTGAVPKERLVLHVGSFTDRKNVPFIVSAFRKAAPPGYRLVLCGGVQDRLRHTPIQPGGGVEIRTGAGDAELRDLYARASHVVCASHYEGFGLPVLEGIAHGAVPLLSDIPVFRELFPEGSIFFSPRDPATLESVFATLPPEIPDPSFSERTSYLGNYDHVRSATTIAELLRRLHQAPDRHRP